MEKLQTPVAYLDAPEFARYWDTDAKRLSAVLKNLGCIEEKSK
jgi:hypothetical protein